MGVAFGNVINNTGPVWHAEPNTRGSWSILSSCLITISLCAWTALHLNLPEHKKADRQWMRKTKWLFLGLIAPETVAYIAWRQHKGAKKILKDVRVHLGQPAPRSRWGQILHKCLKVSHMPSSWSRKLEVGKASMPPARVRRSEWSLVHGFYAIMGGLALDSSDSAEPFLPASRTRAALTPEGIRFLLQHEPNFLPNISEEEIKDKSKADGLKKFLVCAQAIWFGINFITRLAQKLPISLLELNAVGHAACALLIYWMWWYKPLDVDEPTLIKGEDIEPLFAYMWMSSHISAIGLKTPDLDDKLRDEFDALWMYQNPRFEDLVFGNDKDIHISRSLEQGKPLPTMAAALNFGLESPLYNAINRQHTASQPMLRIKKWLHSKRFPGIRYPPGIGVRRTAVEHLSATDIRRWKLAHQAIERYYLEIDLCTRHHVRSHVYGGASRVKARIPNHLSLIGSKPREVWLGFATAGILYGGLHMLAWDAPFSSRAEQILWRISASAVTIAPLYAGPIVIASPIALQTLTKYTQNDHDTKGFRLWAHRALLIMVMLMMTVAPLLWFTYVLGRVYLIVECFKNVAHLPPGAFEDVSWPAYLPHIN